MHNLKEILVNFESHMDCVIDIIHEWYNAEDISKELKEKIYDVLILNNNIKSDMEDLIKLLNYLLIYKGGE